MSDAVTALNGGSFGGVIRVEDAGLTGMVTLRTDLGDADARAALSDAGVTPPETGQAVTGDETGILWMSPDELMLVGAYGQADDVVARLSDALSGHHHLAVNVSDARSVLRLTGEGAAIREVLAKLTPADMRASRLPVGQVRRTRLAQVPAAFWFTGEDEAMVICFRSVADYVMGLISNAAAPGGEIGYF